MLQIDSKTRRVALKNRKQEEFDKQRDHILHCLDLNEDNQSGKIAKQVAQQRKIRGTANKRP